MDTLIDKLLNVGGPLGVLVIIVLIFVRDRRDSANIQRQYNKDATEAQRIWMQEMHGEHLDAREQSRLTVGENTRALGENTKSNVELTAAVRRMEQDRQSNERR